MGIRNTDICIWYRLKYGSHEQTISYMAGIVGSTT
jgi:hypothetical protein